MAIWSRKCDVTRPTGGRWFTVQQSPLDFFKLVESPLIFMPLYDSLNLIISGAHQPHVGSWGHSSEKVKLRGLDCVAYKMCQCAVLLEDKIIIYNVFGSY